MEGRIKTPSCGVPAAVDSKLQEASTRWGSRLHEWFESVLLLERTSVCEDLERRHMAVIAELEVELQKVRQELFLAPSEAWTEGLEPRSDGSAESLPLASPQDHVSATVSSALNEDPLLDVQQAGQFARYVSADQDQSARPGATPNANQVLPDSPTLQGPESQKSIFPYRKRLASIDYSDMEMLEERFSPSFSRGPQNTWSSRLTKFVVSYQFEACSAVLVLCTAVAMAIEAQLHGLYLGNSVGHSSPIGKADYKPLFRVCEFVLGVMFSLEVLLKLCVLRVRFMLRDIDGTSLSKWLGKRLDWWNLLDSVIVLCWAIGQFRSMSINPSFIRLLRLARLLRLLRLGKTLASFQALYLLTSTLRASTSALLWTAVLLFGMHITLALAMNQLLESFYTNLSKSLSERREIWLLFGTFTRSLFTVFEMTLGNYGPIGRTLMETVSEWSAYFSIAHKCTMGFAMLSVVRGVFMHETFKVAATDDNIMMVDNLNAKKVHRRKMERLFLLADSDQSNNIEVAEFKQACRNPIFQTWLGLGDQDADDAFTLLATDGQLTRDQLIDGMSKLKGHARSIDIAVMRREMHAFIEKADEKLDMIPSMQQATEARMWL